jgi:hypothetical protein
MTEVTEDLIQDLLRDQHPDLAGLPLTFGAKGLRRLTATANH